MGIYSRFVLPRVIDYVCATKPSMRQREKIVPQAAGRVLEVGIGSGLNLAYYDSGSIQRVWGIDPSAEILAMARKRTADVDFDVELVEAGAESIPLDDASIDTVVVTYSLCTIPDRAGSLTEMRRVLTDHGRLLFCEHGAAPDKSVRKWQDRINPIWKLFGGGCNLNIDIPDALRQGGFEIESLETMYLPGLRFASFNYWGSARAAS